MAKMYLPVQQFGIRSSWQASRAAGSGTWSYTTPSTARKSIVFQASNLPIGSTVQTAVLTYTNIYSTTSGVITCRGIPGTTSRSINVADIIETDADGHFQDFSVEFTYQANGHYPTSSTASSGTYDSTATVQLCQVEVNYTSGTETGYDAEEYMAAAKAASREIRPRGVITYADGAYQPLTPEDIINFEINEGTDDGILLGQALTAKMQLQLANIHGEWLPGGACRGERSIKGATVTLEIGLMVDGNYMYTPAGIFVIEEIAGMEGSPYIELKGHDMMTAIMESHKFADGLTYPATINQIFQEIITQSGFGVEGLPYINTAVRLAKKPDWGEECTLRQALGFVMSATASYAFMSRDGKIGVKPAWESDPERTLELEPEHYLNLEYNENSFTFNRISIAPRNAKSDSDNIVSAVDSSIEERQSNTLYIEDNPIMTKGWTTNQQIADGIKTAMTGANWHGMKAQWRGNPSVTIGTRITLTDTRGEDTETTIAFQCLRWTKGFSATAECSIDSDESIKAGALTSAGMINTKLISENGIIAYMLSPGSVETDKLADGAVEAGKIAANAVTADKINAGAVTAGKIAADAVTADKIAAGAVEADAIAAGAVTTGKLAADSVTADKIAAGAVEADAIAAGAVTTGKLAANSVQAGNIAAGSVSAAKMVAGTITAESGIIAASAIGTTQIADGSITDAKIVSLTANKLTAGTIDASQIYVINLTADNITTGTINGQRIPVLGTDKLADGAVTGNKVASNAITADKIVAGAVTTEKIAAQAVTANEILAGSITGDRLSANTVTANKLAADVGASLDISSNTSINLLAKQMDANPNLLVSTDMTQYPYNNALIWEAPTEWVECYDTEYTIGYQLYNGGYLYALSYDAIERLQGIEEKYMLANWQTGSGHSIEMQLAITNTPTVVYFWVASNDQNRYVSIYAQHNGEVPQEQRDQGYHSKIRIKNLKLYCLNSGADIVYPYKATGFYQNMPPNFGAGYTTMYEFKENGTYTFSIGKVKNASVSDWAELGCIASLWNMSGYSQGDHSFAVSDEKQSFTFTLSNANTHDVRLFLYASDRQGERYAVRLEQLKLEKGDTATVWTSPGDDNKFASLEVSIDGISATVNDPTIGNAALKIQADGISSSVASVDGRVTTEITQRENAIRLAAQGNAGANSNIFFNHPEAIANYLSVFSNPAGFLDIYNLNTATDYGVGYKEYSLSSVPLPEYTSQTRFTYSFWAKADVPNQALYVFMMYDGTDSTRTKNSQGYESDDIYGTSIFNLSTNWEHYWVNARCDVVRSNFNYLVLGRIYTPYANVYITGCKLEKGEYATRWVEDKLHNSSIDINTSGIDILTDGKLNMNAGTLTIDAKDGTNSHIKLGTDGDGQTFSVDETGSLNAKRASFDELTVKNGSVMVKGVNLVIGSARPTGHGIVWLEPLSGNVEKEYSYTPPKTNTFSWNDSSVAYHTRSITFDQVDTATIAGSGTFTYTVSIPYARLTGGKVITTISGSITRGGVIASFSGINVTFNLTEEGILTFQFQSTANIASAQGSITVTITLASITGSVYIKSATGTNKAIVEASLPGGTQDTCNVHYIA